MRVKSIEIDGFKSYAHRQVIDGFDDQFNAITGLNGSGKSNILDSICFVLGITNLSQIRASNMNDLIFKQGQAGITKATVTIKFDNTGERKPAQYANDSEVVIRRTISLNAGSSRANQYCVNGTQCSNAKVADLFRSVGLNVNNPHFLIMQGRITKVLNMKPLEILGMIEEAAGTKMYDQKRNAALLIVDRKEKRVEEIKKMMEDDILPVVQRMKDDRAEFLKYQKMERDIAVLKRKHAAYSYQDAIRNKEEVLEEKAAMRNKREEEVKTMAETDKELKKMTEDLKTQEEKKGEDKMKELESIDGELSEKNAAYLKAESIVASIKNEMKETEQELKRVKKNAAKDEQEREKKVAELERVEKEIGGSEQAGIQLEEEVKAAKSKLEALEQGMTTNDSGEVVTLESQITQARTRLTEITSETKRREMRRKELTKKREEKVAEMAKYAKEDKANTEWRKRTALEINRVTEEIAAMNYDEEKYAVEEEKYRKMEEEMRTARDHVRHYDNKIIQLEPQYRQLSNFNGRDLVVGSVARCFRLKDLADCDCIGFILGSSVVSTTVVKTQEAAKRLFNEKAFTRRVTVYPMDTFFTKKDPRIEGKVKLARSIAGPTERVDSAVDLVSYEKKYESIVRTGLQHVIVCDRKESASKICFHRDIMMRTVTRTGFNDYKPSGVLTGGSKPSRSSLDLAIVEEYHKAREKAAQLEGPMAELEAFMQRERGQYEKYIGLKRRLTELKEQMEAHKEKNKFSAAATLQADLEAIDEELPLHEKFIAETAEEMKQLQEKISQFEERKKNEKAYAEREKKECEKKLKECLARQKAAEGTFNTAKQTLTSMRLVVENLELSIEKAKEEIAEMEAKIEELTKRKAEADEQMKESNEIVSEVKGKKKAFNDRMKKLEDAQNALRAKIDETKKEQHKRQAAIEDMETEGDRKEEEAKQWAHKAQQIMKEHPWIAEEKEHFGQKGTDFDFEGYSYSEGKKQIEEMESEMKKMNTHINVQTMNMLAPSEERVISLQKKQAQLEQDKKKLMETIKVLDEKKKKELLEAFHSVNKDFGNIFSTLLPGTFAKLEPAHNDDPLKGVEIKVAFNGKWKESLGELSGGQRSLVALSLVLAMLKFRPAPIYILDEVDAALDLSHTQNIGAMIKKHFNQSQFIIVSLKEGMFNHANVLFKTRFVDGTSQVTRIDNRKK